MRGLFSGELIFGGGYYWKEFCTSKWVWLDNKNSLKQPALTVPGLIFGRAYYQKDFCVLDLGGLFLGGLIFGADYYWNFAVCAVSLLAQEYTYNKIQG